MDGLKKRHSLLETDKETVEVLDGQEEQDQIVEELRLQNDRSNTYFKV
ncbi:13500_t:CDS:2 [Entrophospora sp. SA101]|nr:13500_t:CDS:2 [Entrophospora sp. SA101]